MAHHFRVETPRPRDTRKRVSRDWRHPLIDQPYSLIPLAGWRTCQCNHHAKKVKSGFLGGRNRLEGRPKRDGADFLSTWQVISHPESISFHEEAWGILMIRKRMTRLPSKLNIPAPSIK